MQRSAEQAGPPRQAAERTQHLPPVDLSRLRRFTLGNVELEQEILGLFALQAPIMLAALRRANTPVAWHEAGHTLKGSSASIGAWLVADAAEQAEKLAERPDDWEQARRNVAQAIHASLVYLADVSHSCTAARAAG
jgi:HPt (histidine-containing phosphotransfer) domain-containing protein